MNLDNLFESYIGRIVAWVFYPIFAVVIPPVVTFVNDLVGTDLTEQQVSNVAIATIVGVAALFWKWLDNRGLQEAQAVANKLQETYERGAELVDVEENPGRGATTN